MFLTRWMQRPKHNRPAPRDRRPRFRPAVEALEDRRCPSFGLVTSRAALVGADSVDWGTLLPTPPPISYFVASPFTILSTAGTSITVSKTQVSSFDVTTQLSAPPYQGNGTWNGNFAEGDRVLYTTPGDDRALNTITLDFGSTPVSAGGAQIQPNSRARPFNFTAQVDAFDAAGHHLASFTEKGSVTDAADNSAIFIGISSTSANISRIALSIKNISGGERKSAFAINEFDFQTSPLALVAAPAAADRPLAGDPSSLTSSTIATTSQMVTPALMPEPAAPPAPGASQNPTVPTDAMKSAARAGATGVGFASPGATKHDDSAESIAPIDSAALGGDVFNDSASLFVGHDCMTGDRYDA